jgi:hypothetical protein
MSIHVREAQPVADISYNEDESYIGSWVADVCLAYDYGDVLSTYRQLQVSLCAHSI